MSDAPKLKVDEKEPRGLKIIFKDLLLRWKKDLIIEEKMDDPYKEGQKSKILDVFLGIFLIPGELLVFWFSGWIGYYMYQFNKMWIIVFGIFWGLTALITVIGDVMLMIRFWKMKRKCIVLGLILLVIGIPVVMGCMYLILTLTWSDEWA
ncbi:MAG: hypothetical protein ACTSWW_09815 [Promethearchaeota archaeon]